jgi:hypothetical protein
MKMARLVRAVILKGINMSVQEHLRSCRELNKLCSRNGWMDNDTLAVHIEQRDARHVVAAVNFDEVIMEGAGYMADRQRRYLRAGGDASHVEVLSPVSPCF